MRIAFSHPDMPDESNGRSVIARKTAAVYPKEYRNSDGQLLVEIDYVDGEFQVIEWDGNGVWYRPSIFKTQMEAATYADELFQKKLGFDVERNRFASLHTAGWSCTRAAGEIMDGWVRLCSEQTGKQNVYEPNNGGRFFWEIGREQADGSIVGAVWDLSGGRAGSFKINADGTVARYPKGWPFAKTASRHTAAATPAQADAAYDKAAIAAGDLGWDDDQDEWIDILDSVQSVVGKVVLDSDDPRDLAKQITLFDLMAKVFKQLAKVHHIQYDDGEWFSDSLGDYESYDMMKIIRAVKSGGTVDFKKMIVK